MTGRPKLMKLQQDLDNLALERGYESGEEWIFELVEDGMSTRAMSDYLTRTLGYYVSRGQFQRWGKMGDRYPRLQAARRRSALNLVEDGGEILDDLAEESKSRMVGSGEVSLAKERASHRRYLAGRFDPDTFGDKADVEVNFSVGDLHLDALTAASQRAKALSAENVQEAEVIEDDSPDALPAELSELTE